MSFSASSSAPPPMASLCASGDQRTAVWDCRTCNLQLCDACWSVSHGLEVMRRTHRFSQIPSVAASSPYAPIRNHRFPENTTAAPQLPAFNVQKSMVESYSAPLDPEVWIPDFVTEPLQPVQPSSS